MTNQFTEEIVILDANGNPTIKIQASKGNIIVGGPNADGDIFLHPGDTPDNNDRHNATIFLDADGGRVWIGGNKRTGEILMHPSDSVKSTRREYATIRLNADDAKIWMGGKHRDGGIIIFSKDAANFTNPQFAAINIDGATGDIKLAGADCAEEFDIVDNAEINPGTVLVMNNNNLLEPCANPYDQKVIGVVSGASNTKPGIILGRVASDHKRLPIALTGKVYCNVNADYAPIQIGDLLTTSATAGFAMKASIQAKSFGAVLGKALQPLNSGTGLIPILVTLQ